MAQLRRPLPTPWQIVPSAEYQREHPPKSAEDLEREVRVFSRRDTAARVRQAEGPSPPGSSFDYR